MKEFTLDLETNLSDLPLFRSVLEKPRYRFTFDGGAMTVEPLNVDAQLEIANLQQRVKPEPEPVKLPLTMSPEELHRAFDNPTKVRSSVKKKKVQGGNVQYFSVLIKGRGTFYFRTRKSTLTIQEIFSHKAKFGRMTAAAFQEAKKSHGARLSSLSSIVKLL